MNITFFAKSDTETPSTNYRCNFLAQELKNRGFDIHTIFPLSLSTENKILDKVYRSLVLGKRVHELIQNRETDVLFVQGTPYRIESVPLIKIFVRWNNLPWIFNFDDANFLHRPYITRWLTESADLVLVPSQNLMDYARFFNNNVKHFPLGVDTKLFQPGENVLKSDEFTMIWFGNTQSHFDNLIFLKKVFEALDTNHNVKLQIAGEPHDELKNLFADLTINCDFPGYLEQAELVTYLDRADIGLVPIRSNLWNNSKFPVKIMEMISTGLPVIASANSEARNILVNGKHGFVIPNRADRWCEKIEWFLNHPRQRVVISQNNRELAQSKFSITHLAKRAENFLIDLVDPS